MKSKTLFLSFCLFTASACLADPVKLLIDTDFESDVDDVAALALAHAYVEAGQAEILGVAIAGKNPESAPAVHALNAYFGRPEIPVGVRKEGVDRKSVYTGMLIREYPAEFDVEAAPDAVNLYRKILAAAEPKSVTVVSLGYLTNPAALLSTGPDEYSPLTGMELVKQKVKHYVCMGGAYPRQSKTGSWGNFLPDPAAVKKVNADWPTPVIYTGGAEFSRMIMTGGPFMTAIPEGGMVREAYQLFFKKSSWARGPTHHSADLIAIAVAVEGFEPWLLETKHGYSHIFEDATMEWRTDKDVPDRSYVAKFPEGMTGEKVAAHYNELIVELERGREQE